MLQIDMVKDPAPEAGTRFTWLNNIARVSPIYLDKPGTKIAGRNLHKREAVLPHWSS